MTLNYLFRNENIICLSYFKVFIFHSGLEGIKSFTEYINSGSSGLAHLHLSNLTLYCNAPNYTPSLSLTHTLSLSLSQPLSTYHRLSTIITYDIFQDLCLSPPRENSLSCTHSGSLDWEKYTANSSYLFKSRLRSGSLPSTLP